MKIYIAEYQPDRIGGGWSFMRNFAEGINQLSDLNLTFDYAEADIYFICSPSMVQRDAVEKAREDGKKIVLRIDNAVRNSRNRNTGMSRMKDFYQWADLVIFQSLWAKRYLSPFLAKSEQNVNKIILNGVDLEKYSNNHEVVPKGILYSRFNRDETKNWEVARYWFSRHQLVHPDAVLHIVGQFSPELVNGNFDFYDGENFEYHGVVDDTLLAKYYSECSLLYTYYNDACSNTLIEALASRAPIVGDAYYKRTGGAPEIIDAFSKFGREYFSFNRMADEYNEAIRSIL